MTILSNVFSLFVYLFGSVAKFDFLIYFLLLFAFVIGAINIYNFIRKGKY